MKILFVSAVLPYPLYSGGQVRIYNLLKILSKTHQITLLSFIRNKRELNYLSKLDFLDKVDVVMRGKRLQPKYLFKFLTSNQSLLSCSYDSRLMRDKINRFCTEQRPDLIHIEPFYVYPSLSPTDIPLVVSEHNIEYEVYMRFAQTYRLKPIRALLTLEANRIRNEEIRTLKKSKCIVAVSREDELKIQEIAGDKPVSVVPNGVDTGFFKFKSDRFKFPEIKLLFVGNFNWLPNMEALYNLRNKIWPFIKSSLPQAKLYIIGQGLKSGAGSSGEDIFYNSRVEDIRTMYNQSDALIAPIHISGGSKFKILEALASGLPVITTSSGISGLDYITSKLYKNAVTDRDYIQAIIELIKFPKKTVKMTRDARKFVEDNYSWSQIALKLDKLWTEAPNL